MSEDQAATQAAAMATTHSMRFVHNLHDRTQWTATMRNWAPFYFAQEQAYRRMGRFLAEDPGGFRRYQMMIAGVHDLATNVQDSNGNKYIGGRLGWGAGPVDISVDYGDTKTFPGDANGDFILNGGKAFISGAGECVIKAAFRLVFLFYNHSI